MKKYAAVFSAVVLLAVTSLNCGQNSDKAANLSVAAGPDLRWKYETGG